MTERAGDMEDAAFNRLLEAGRDGRVDTVRAFVDQGADVHAQNECGNMTLLQAAGNGYGEAVRVL